MHETRCMLLQSSKLRIAYRHRPFKNYLRRVNHSQCTRANAKNIVLPKVKSETRKEAFCFQGAKVFNKLTNEMNTETLILHFTTLRKKF